MAWLGEKIDGARRFPWVFGTAAGYQPVCFFGAGQTESADLDPETRRTLLGGKGAGLAEMSMIQYDDPVTGGRQYIPVPPGYTITTAQALRYFNENSILPEDLRIMIEAYQARLESAMGKRLGNPTDPLLVSVRSGARVSMPGMMDTVLNLGLNDAAVAGLVRQSGDARFAWDSYRRFVEMFSDVVLGVPRQQHLKPVFGDLMRRQDYRDETELTVADLQHLVEAYKGVVRNVTGQEFPGDPMEQLFRAIKAVFDSSFNERAVTYRRINELPEDTVSAVNVQAMVFGNRGETSATGVAFTRSPITGERIFDGEYLTNAQGEDVVAGIRTGRGLADMASADSPPELQQAYRRLVAIQQALEHHFRDAQDIEFTIEEGWLWILQTRRLGGRTGRAALRIAVEMTDEGLISREEALIRFGKADRLNEVLLPVFDPEAEREAEREGRFLTQGVAASAGAAQGSVVFSSEEATRLSAEGERVILVRTETSPEDVGGMHAAQGILTTRGGSTSHAAIVARGMGKAAVVGAEGVEIDEVQALMRVGQQIVRRGEPVAIDGSTGKVYLGSLSVIDSPVKRKVLGLPVDPGGEKTYCSLMALLGWAAAVKAMEVRANADTAGEAETAMKLGAEGIGLFRSEHAVLESTDRRVAFAAMLLAVSKGEREQALSSLLPQLREDARALVRALVNRDPLRTQPVTIRLFDPVVNEFLPQTEVETVRIAEFLGVSPAEVQARTQRIREVNPMLGYRGVRLVVISPEIAAIQARAIFEGVTSVMQEGGKVLPEIEIPLVIGREEVERVTRVVRQVAAEVMEEQGFQFDFRVGVMVETPAGVRTASEYAPLIEFVWFGMNDLTQTVLAMSRDDAGRFLPLYQAEGIFTIDPFKSLDVKVVGSFITEATERARTTNSSIYVGAAGDLGGDPVSVEFFHRAGLNGVSATPWLVPVAILAAAQAQIRHPRNPWGRPHGQA
ncbi:MAG: pyruvate, phosphate dikinase [Candidatus Methylomirabilales bacterium]